MSPTNDQKPQHPIGPDAPMPELPLLPTPEPSLEIPEALRTPVRRPELPGAAKGNISGLGVGVAMAMDFVGSIGGGAVLGYLFDRWQATLPTGTLVGLSLGFVAAMIRIVRTSQRSEREEHARKLKNKHRR